MSRRAASALVAALALGLSALPIDAQDCVEVSGSTRPCHATAHSRAEGELLVLGANVAVGALTAGIRQWRAEDGSFWNGLWQGALGGLGTYAGKRIVTSEMPGAGFLGRGVAATGASMTRNAADGRPLFETLVLPVAFARMHWQPARGEVHTSFDIPGIAAIAGVYASGLGPSLDLGRTLDTGTPVFMAREWDRSTGWHGRHVFGAILLRGDSPLFRPEEHAALVERALHHERIHVLQYDQAYILWNQPIEKRVLSGLGSPAWLVRSMDLSVHALGVAALKGMLPDTWQVWEHEADIMTGTRRDRTSPF